MEKGGNIRWTYNLLILLLLLSILILTFRNTNEVEVMNINNQQDSLYSVLKEQKQYTDSLMKYLDSVKLVAPTEINNYYKNITNEKIKIIDNYTNNDLDVFITKWYLSKKSSN